VLFEVFILEAGTTQIFIIFKSRQKAGLNKEVFELLVWRSFTPLFIYTIFEYYHR